jgi:CBS domain containing-hemolysin-like protein
MQNPFTRPALEDRVAGTLLGASLAALGLAIAVLLSAGGLTPLSPSARGVVLSALLIAGVLKVASRLARPIGRWLNEQS